VASYYVWSGATGSANGTSWANAYTTLTLAFSGKAAGDVFYVAHDHAESTAGAVTLTATGSTLSIPNKVICVNRAGSVPPVSADRRATATVTASGPNNITVTGYIHYDGIIFVAGTGTTSSGSLILGTAANHWMRFDNCSLRLGITAGGGGTILVGGSSGSLGAIYVELNNTTMSFGAGAGLNTVQVVTIFKWRNTPSALLGVMPNTLFSVLASHGGLVECIGVDLSAMGAGKTIAPAGASTSQAVTYRFIDCKLDAAVTKSDVPTQYGTCECDFIRSGAAGVNYAVYRSRGQGTLTEETTIVRTGGASNGTTTIAWKIVTTGNCAYSMPFECPPVAIWVDTVGTPVTATVEGIWGGGAVPNDDDIWVEVEYLGDASSPQGSFVNDGKADLLAAAAGQASSSETWGGSTTKFKLNVTFTPQLKGWLYCRVKVGKASTTVYIDPLVVLT
jgi:hypothetical protein